VAAEVVEIIHLAAFEWPWWGYKRVAVALRSFGVREATNKAVYRVYRAQGLLRRRRPQAAELHQAQKLYELLPRNPDELWQADVTYINIPGHGWWYAVTVIDYYSRYLLACHLTDSFSAKEVMVGLDAARAEAERVRGGPLPRPPTLVTDNGVSFTAQAFNRHLAELGIPHVRIRYRTPQQLGLLERFHAVLKQEEVYWNLYTSPADCRAKLAEFQRRYNEIRPHWALKPETGGDVVAPEAVYRGRVRPTIPRWQGWARDAKARLDAKLAAIAPKPPQSGGPGTAA
jgi:putative transposase